MALTNTSQNGRSFVRSVLRRLCYPLGLCAVRAYRVCEARVVLRAARTLLDIQLNMGELEMVQTALVNRSKQARFLVFGLGRDSEFWRAANGSGLTVFLEDDPRWYDRVTRHHRKLRAHLVRYSTRRESSADLMQTLARDALVLELPEEVSGQQWDVVLVDGPAGYVAETPGRLQSILTARKVAAAGADVFVHDVDRQLERSCCDTFFADSRLVRSVGRMRHYRVGA